MFNDFYHNFAQPMQQFGPQIPDWFNWFRFGR
jgi:hypothetical protein